MKPVIAAAGLLAAALVLGACGSEDSTTTACVPSRHPAATAVADVAEAPPDAVVLGAAAQSDRVPVTITLAQKLSFDEMVDLTSKVTANDAAERLAPASFDDVLERTGAPDSAVAAVDAFFASHGLTGSVDPTRTFGTAEMTATQVNDAFRVKLLRYRDRRGGCADSESADNDCTFIAPEAGQSVSVPADLVAALPNDCEPQRHVRGLTTRRVFPESGLAVAAPIDNPYPWMNASGTPDPLACAGATTADPDNAFTPGFTYDQLRTAYRFPDEALPPGTAMAILTQNHAVCADDLGVYASCFKLTVPEILVARPTAQNPAPEYATDGACSSALDQEPTLDGTMITSMAKGLATIYDGVFEPTAAGFQTTLGSVIGLHTKGVRVISMSYGACEERFPSGFGASFQAVETLLMKAAQLGMTFVTGSGDTGSSACSINGMAPFAGAAQYPASSTWAVGVGATNLILRSDNSIATSEVWNDAPATGGAQNSASGGEVSGINAGKFTGFPRPDWQKGRGVVLAEKRQVPDVAYFGDAYPGMTAYIAGWTTVEGTSMAAPLFASAILYYNAHHATPLGHANPVLYAGVLNESPAKLDAYDIVDGNNVIQGSGTPDCCSAGVGYDKATGLGSIYVDSLVAY